MTSERHGWKWSRKMPHAERYFSRQEFDSSFEPCLKKSKLDYSSLCNKRNAEEFIPLEAQSEKRSSSGFLETGHYGSDKGEHEKLRVSDGFLNSFDNEAKPESCGNSSSEAHYSRGESKPDYSTLSKKWKTEEFIPLETPSEEWSSSELLETRHYGPDKGEHKKPRVNDFLNGFDSEAIPESSRNASSDYSRRESYRDYSPLCKKRNTEAFIPLEKWSSSGLNSFDNEPNSGSSRNDSSEAHYRRRENSYRNQQILELPKTDEWKNNNSKATFSETSTAFIGPLYRPPPQEESRTAHNENSKSPSFRITTVALGKAASKTKSEDGMNYELGQFYKELHELETTTDDHNISQTIADSQQPPSSYQNNAPSIHQFRDHHSQESSLQPCNPLPSKQSVLVPPSYHPNEAPISPAGHPALPPINYQNFSDRPAPFDRTNSFFVRPSLPPPGFQGPPPPNFIVPFGPPPQRYNYPLIFPRGDNLKNSPYRENEKYHSVNHNHPWPTIPSPWHNSNVLPENRFSPQSKGYAEPFPRSPIESPKQAYQREDFCEQQGRPFTEIRLPQGGNAPHEQYPPKFRDEIKCTDLKRKLVMLRGLPGSGKSTLARTLLDQSPNGIVFSTDDYFCQEKGYIYDVKLLGDAHIWNQNRARRAMDDGRSPIVIDNTNSQGWEMKPYVQMAIDSGYGVEFLEPNTWWKLDPHELEKRNTHRVPREKISQMLERFEHDMNVGIVMNSVEPRHVRSSRPPPEARQRWGASVDCTPHSTSFQIR